MRLRSTILVMAAALGLVTGPAEATVCNLLVDHAGDGRHAAVPVLEADALDLLSGDVASGPTTVVGVLRLPTTDPGALGVLGVRWVLAFEIDGQVYSFSLQRQAGPFGVTDRVGPAGATVVVDATTITWTAPRTAFPALDPGDTFERLAATSSLFGGSADTMLAPPGTTYVDQTPSCVPAA